MTAPPELPFAQRRRQQQLADDRKRAGSQTTRTTANRSNDTNEPSDVTVVGFTMASVVPIPAFMTTAFMDAYETDPVKLCLIAVKAIKERAADDPDTGRAERLAEAASYVPRWIMSVIINIKRTTDTTIFGVKITDACHRRADDWAKETHLKFLAVRARSLISADEQPATPRGADEVIRNLTSLLERQASAITSVTPPAAKTGFDSFPPSTKQMILFVSERDVGGNVPSHPVRSFADILALSNVAYVQNHVHNFLRNTKGRDVLLPTGFCAAIKTASFVSDVSDRPGAFSLFCCGPQALERTTTGNREAADYANSMVQMQLKTTDTTTGLSEKDIKTMTKLSYTIPHDFHELARLVENMAGVTELIFGAFSPLTGMLEEWSRFLTKTVGSTLATLRRLAHTDKTAACRLGWFIDRRMQQYLVLCAGVENEHEINPALLEFRTTRQQLEDGAFVYPACDFLQDRLGRGASTAKSEPNNNASTTSAGARPARRPPADEVINPQSGTFSTDADDNWQVFINQAKSGPIPNMCCRWHLNGKCVKSCYYSASHIELKPEQIESVRAWIEQCRTRMRRPTTTTGSNKKQKLGNSESAYSRPTCSIDPRTAIRPISREPIPFHNRRPSTTTTPFRHHPSWPGTRAPPTRHDTLITPRVQFDEPDAQTTQTARIAHDPTTRHAGSLWDRARTDHATTNDQASCGADRPSPSTIHAHAHRNPTAGHRSIRISHADPSR